MKSFWFLPLIILLFGIGCSTPENTKDQNMSVHPREIIQADWVKDAIIYEVNIRQFTPEGTFKAFESHLPRLRELGVDILWLMPIHPIGEENKKGPLGSYYAVRDYYAINPEFGTREDFKNLVKKVHELDMYLILDWVPNHTAWDNELANRHPDWYYLDDQGDFMPPIGTDWTDVIALDYSNRALQKYMKDALTYWVEEFDIDGYRCDVAGYVPTPFWREARARLDSIKPVFMLAEWEQRDMYDAFDMTYAWELESLLQKVAQGEENASVIKKYLDEHFNTYPLDYIRMNFTSNHDKNSWEGTVFDRFGKAAEVFAVLTYTVEGMPLIYSGQEVGLKKELRFFEKDTIMWGDHPFNALYARLGKLKKDHPVLWNGKWGGRVKSLETTLPEKVVAFTRKKEKSRVFAMFNMSDQPVEFSIKGTTRHTGKYKSFVTRENIEIDEEESYQLGPWKYEILIK